jgi:tripartite-type tricarboxylate transporter receptor subunit TctC
MLLSRSVLGMFSVGLMVLGAGVVSGQAYPNKPIRIVTAAVGGGSDFTSRLIAQGISVPLGQPVIVDNRSVGISAPEIVAKALPDGHTLLFGSFWIDTLLYKAPYDPVRDFSPITLATRSPNILVVHPSVPVKSVKELIALTKAKPGELNYGSGGPGSTPHLAGELFKAMAGVNIVHIPYKGSGAALLDVIGGQVQLMFATAASAMPQVKGGKLRALAVTSAQPSALAPGLPPVAGSLPGYEATLILGMFAPAKTPGTIINRLNQEIVRVLNTAEAKEKFLNAAAEIVGSSPAELAGTMKAEMARWGKLIKDTGIKPD